LSEEKDRGLKFARKTTTHFFKLNFPTDAADAVDESGFLSATSLMILQIFLIRIRHEKSEVFMMDNLKHKDLSDKVLKAFYKVYNTLGYGFLEKVYERALLLELGNQGLKSTRQQPIKVYYGANPVGDYFADIIVEGKIIIEVKIADAICDAHIAQLRNYLKATVIEVGLLLNFGPEPKFARRIFSNENKQIFNEQKIRVNPLPPQNQRGN
jgi:GxxExxY protein